MREIFYEEISDNNNIGHITLLMVCTKIGKERKRFADFEIRSNSE